MAFLCWSLDLKRCLLYAVQTYHRRLNRNFLNLYDKTIMIGRSYSARVSDVITRNSGDIYEIRMGELWEKCFSDMTFGMFKAKFFHGELFEQDGANRISDRLHKSIITRILKTFVPNYINI